MFRKFFARTTHQDKSGRSTRGRTPRLEALEGRRLMSGTYTARDTATGFNLDSNPNGQRYTFTTNGGAFQKWELIPSGDGYYTLRDDATGLYLDSNPNGQAYTLAPNGGDFQKWWLTSLGGGAYYLRDKATGLYLDSN